MGVELERKYRAEGAEQLAEILTWARTWAEEPERSMDMHTLYFDTLSDALAARRWVLRLRMEVGTGVICCKTPLPDGARGEWEVRGNDAQAAVPALIAAGAPAELAELTRTEVLIPRCGATFTRRALTLRMEHGAVELACDAGELEGRTQYAPLCEVELELKSGDARALEEAASLLTARFALPPEQRSKAERARALP